MIGYCRRLRRKAGVGYAERVGARLRAAGRRGRRPQQHRAALRRHQRGSCAVSILYDYSKIHNT